MSAVSVSSQPVSLARVQRLLATALPESEDPGQHAPLEISASDSRPARLISAAVIEGSEITARPVPGRGNPTFAAFLGGTQKSEIARYLRGGVPIVLGTVAAVVRDRRDRRMHTWRHVVERALYLPKSQTPSSVLRALRETGLPVLDTGDGDESSGAEHPLAMREAAVHRVQIDRERVEQTLALDWCGREGRVVLVDGSISGADGVARAEHAVGVVKTHRTIYASGDALGAVLGLGKGCRSSAFLVTSPRRATVASWYLRIRDPRGHDPMWGLVRVEIAASAASGGEITERADEVSRWILAEEAPVSLPDGRWDKMVYGVRDCEEFLRAIV